MRGPGSPSTGSSISWRTRSKSTPIRRALRNDPTIGTSNFTSPAIRSRWFSMGKRSRKSTWTISCLEAEREGDAERGYNDRMSHASILGPDGAIARRLPNYETRPEQLEMADAVAAALAAPGHLMVEAGTGVGKSFAYLVPAIQAACATKDYRVVISTHTIGLQEQLIRKDIPFLQSVMPQQFAALLVK